MATAGPSSPGTLADDSSFGTIAWTNPGNAGASDSSYATATSAGLNSHYLKATNFGFSVPAGATITSIKVDVLRKQDNSFGGDTVDVVLKLVKGGAVTGNDKHSASSWPTSDATASYDYSLATWGVALTPADVNASDFGVVLAVNTSAGLGANPIAYVNLVQVTVTYTPAGQSGAASMLMAV